MKKYLSLILLIFPIGLVNAASFGAYATANSVNVGGSVSVCVSSATGSFTMSSTSPLSGGGTQWLEGTNNCMSFTAKSAGTATITVVANNATNDSEELVTGTKTVSVKVNSPSSSSGSSSSSSSSKSYSSSSKKTYSSDNDLSELSIEGYDISPSFSKDTVEYSIELDESVEQIKVNAKASDDKASVSGIGEIKLNSGENNIEIKVTAENGNEKVYKIKANVIDKNPIKVTKNNKEYTIVKRNTTLTIPEGYEEEVIQIEEQDVKVFKNDSNGLILFVLKNSDGKENFYIYNFEKYPLYKEYNIGSLRLYLLTMNKTKLPKGYKKYKLELNNNKVTAYKLSKNSNYYLLYALNLENGKENLYLYDKKEKTIQRYDKEIASYLTTSLSKEAKQYKNYLYISISVIIAIVLVFFANIIIKRAKKKRK